MRASRERAQRATASRRIKDMMVGESIPVSTDLIPIYRAEASKLAISCRFETGRGVRSRMVRTVG